MKGREAKVIKDTKKNFHILTPTKNIMNMPKKSNIKEVPRSGWEIINEKGIKIIKEGIIRLWIFAILSYRKSW